MPSEKANGLSYTEQEIEYADSVEIKNFYEIDRRGFAKCPFHKDGTPSMHITKNLFYCFGCGEKGRTIKFLMKLQNKSFIEIMKLLQK
jgi:DNA primase